MLVTGPRAPYTVGWKAVWVDANTLSIEFTVSPPLLGGQGEEMQLGFDNREKFKSTKNATLSPVDAE